MTDPTTVLDVAAAADELHAARLGRRAVPTLTGRWAGMTTADAYAVQAAGIERRLADDERLVGGKLGFTSAAMREAMGVDSPNYGWLTDAMLLDDGVVAPGRLIHPKVEPEIAFRLGHDVGRWASHGDVQAATIQYAACLEVVDSRYEGFRFAALDNVADNSSAGLVALGEWVDAGVGGVALGPLHEIACVVSVDGVERHRATGAAAHGHPAEAVAWMANNCGRPLRAGSVVISGGLTRPVDLVPGTEVTATFTGLGRVTVQMPTD